MMTKFDCTDEGPMKKFIAYIMMVRKTKGENARLKSTQLVLIQSLKDEFMIPQGQAPSICAKPGTALAKNDDEVALLFQSWQVSSKQAQENWCTWCNSQNLRHKVL